MLKSGFIYSVLAICCLVMNSSVLNASPGPTAGNAVVKSESLIVFSRMSAGSDAVKSLKKGEIAIIDFEVGGPEGSWCGIIEEGQKAVSGFVECIHLERADPEKVSWRPLGFSGEEKGGKTTKVLIKNNMVLVPSKIGYGDNSTKAMLLLDTGASHTIINTAVADRLNINPVKTKKVKVQVVGGALVNIRVAKLKYLSVHPHTMNDLLVGIIEDKASPVKFDGLLGMDFLKNLKYQIDFDKMLIQWN